jgi:predicted transcriptional regulator
MLHRQISCLPVVDGKEVKGILTTTDMMMSLQCLMQLLERTHAADEKAATAAAAPIQITTETAQVPVVC